MAINIVPPGSTLGTPFTKLIKLSLGHLGALRAASYAWDKPAKAWKLKESVVGKLTSGEVAFDMGVPQGNRAVMTVDAETWIDDWFGSSQQLVGRHPDGQPFVFGQADFAGGAAGIFSAPGLIHTVSTVAGKKSLRLVTRPALPDASGRKLKPLTDRSTETLITQKTATVGLVLWLESNQPGYLRCKRLPGLNAAVDLAV